MPLLEQAACRTRRRRVHRIGPDLAAELFVLDQPVAVEPIDPASR
jgi:hypothetical protein